MSNSCQKRYIHMSLNKSEGTLENLFGFEQLEAGLEINNAPFFEETTKKLEAYLAREKGE